MKFQNLLESILLESRLEKNIYKLQKLGLNNYVSTYLANSAGPLAIFLAFKILEQHEKNMIERLNEYPPKEMHKRFAKLNNMTRHEAIPSIMDWYRVELNGNIEPYKHLSINELYAKSKEWHESLEESTYIDFKENEDSILLDFRENDGLGYYWVDLGKRQCENEKERMGHCASSRGFLYSFRQYKPAPNGHTYNKSLLTASIGEDGVLLQLKGPKNSKPEKKYHPYIKELLKLNNDGYLIKSFGFEYDSENDFKLTDLDDNDFVELYKERPDLFTKYTIQRKLANLGIIELPERNYVFDLKLRPEDVSSYVSGGWTVKRYKTKEGGTISVDIFETILSGDMWDLWENHDGDWNGALHYYASPENEKVIYDMLQKMAQKQGVELDPEEQLSSLIEEIDDGYEIRQAIQSALSDAESDAYHDYLLKELKEALGSYGDVLNMDDTGVEIRVNLKNLASLFELENYEEQLDEMYDNCNGELDCVFSEIINIDPYGEKPEFRIDDRYYPDVKRNSFNEMLSDRLNDVSI